MYALFVSTNLEISSFPQNPGIYVFHNGGTALNEALKGLKESRVVAFDSDDPMDQLQEFQETLGPSEYFHVYPVSEMRKTGHDHNRKGRVRKGTRSENV